MTSFGVNEVVECTVLLYRATQALMIILSGVLGNLCLLVLKSSISVECVRSTWPFDSEEDAYSLPVPRFWTNSLKSIDLNVASWSVTKI